MLALLLLFAVLCASDGRITVDYTMPDWVREKLIMQKRLQIIVKYMRVRVMSSNVVWCLRGWNMFMRKSYAKM